MHSRFTLSSVLADVTPVVIQVEEFIPYTAANHQGAVETLWLHFQAALILSIFLSLIVNV